MKRPNKLDWFVYHLFYWFWNPIFRDNEVLGKSFANEILFYYSLMDKMEGKDDRHHNQ